MCSAYGVASQVKPTLSLEAQFLAAFQAYLVNQLRTGVLLVGVIGNAVAAQLVQSSAGIGCLAVLHGTCFSLIEPRFGCTQSVYGANT